MGRNKILTEYQELKSNDIKNDSIIVYTPTLETEIIQTKKYLDWIKTHYGTALTFISKTRVYNDQTH